MDDLYRDNILDHFRNPRNYGKLDHPDVSHIESNLVCGDRIGIEIKIKNLPAGKADKKSIEDIRFFGEGCAISMASASLLTEKVKGMNFNSIRKIVPDDIKKMLGIEPTPARLRCALLPLETLCKTLDLVK